MGRSPTRPNLAERLDGTIAEDLTDFRPGRRAAAEHGVRSPLAELGFGKEDVRAAAQILGLHPLEIANEGVAVAVVASRALDRCLDMMHSDPMGRQAKCVGEVVSSPPGAVLLETSVGGHRPLDFPRGLLLPRIC